MNVLLHIVSGQVMLSQCCCPRGNSLSSRILEDQFQVFVLVLVLEAQVLVLVLVLEPQVLVLVLGSSSPSKIVKDCVDYKTSVVSCEILEGFLLTSDFGPC